MVAAWLFWLSVAVPAYAYFGYPATLLLLGLVRHRPVRRRMIEPSVSLLVAAYNEEDVIADKIRNSLALDYPADKLETLIACDGSRDRTVEIARGMADGVRVRVVEFPVNRGKVATLNDAVRQLRGEIIVLSDASAMLHPDAVRQLMTNFADPDVGAAGGKYTVVKAGEAAMGESEDLYWRYETFLKRRESDLASTLGAHGVLNGIRRELYPFPPTGTINDDYVIPMSVLARGYRAVYDPAAIGYEAAQEMSGFRRRTRIATGNIQQIREIRGLLAPLRPLPLFFFVSHKVLRLVVPLAMVAALVSNAFLLASPFFRALFCLQSVFYLLAAVGARWRLSPRLLALPHYFTMINAAVFVALYGVLARRPLAWK
jgi:poly-beta-1,6-N-acetyl-D-glucosamine synthase